MAKAFSIRDFMQDTRQQDSESDVYERISVYDIGLNPRNEYTMSEIEKIKDSIYALGGVQQNVVLVRCPEGADHKYLALDGHRRLTASRELVAEGYGEFEFVPAVIKGQIDNDMQDAMLVMMNSTQRNKTDWERVMEHMRLKEIIPKLKKRQGIDGRARDIEADMLGVSRGQISIYNTIGTKLNAELMKLFENERIGISLAHEAARLEPELQEQLAEMAHDSGSICDEDIRRLVDRNATNGQLKTPDISEKNVPGYAYRAVNEPVPDLETKVNVPESGTSVETGSGPVPDPEVKVNVPESGTFDESLAAVNSEKENKDKKQAVRLRGGYGLPMVDSQISKYKEYLLLAWKENRAVQIHEFNCLLDALDLLRKEMGEKDQYDL